MHTGDAWEIDRCDCKWSPGPGCDQVEGDNLLWGYPVFRDGNTGHVPVAPAQCCRACLGSRIHRLSDCAAVSHCNRRGVCVMGSCQCNRGAAAVEVVALSDCRCACVVRSGTLQKLRRGHCMQGGAGQTARGL
jgi:hypothetical protein